MKNKTANRIMVVALINMIAQAIIFFLFMDKFPNTSLVFALSGIVIGATLIILNSIRTESRSTLILSFVLISGILSALIFISVGLYGKRSVVIGVIAIVIFLIIRLSEEMKESRK